MKSKTKSSIQLLAGAMLAGLGLPSAAKAEDIEAWNMFLVAGPVKDNWVTWTEVQPRYIVDEYGRLGQFLLRQAVGYRFNDNIDVMLGYHWQVRDSDPDFQRRENRIFVHVAGHVFTTDSGLDLQAQFRGEKRMFVGFDDSIYRTRFQLRLHAPLHGKDTFGPVIASETMFNMNSGNVTMQSGLEQQRSSVGLFIPLSENLSTEVSYMHQYLRRMGDDQVIHVANIKFAYKLGSSPRPRYVQGPSELPYVDPGVNVGTVPPL